MKILNRGLILFGVLLIILDAVISGSGHIYGYATESPIYVILVIIGTIAIVWGLMQDNIRTKRR